MAFTPSKVPNVYIHIPFCTHKCDYCDFFSVPSRAVTCEYVAALIKEAKAKIAPSTPLKTIYIGGGNPGLLTTEQLGLILESIKEAAKQKETSNKKNQSIAIKLTPCKSLCNYTTPPPRETKIVTETSADANTKVSAKVSIGATVGVYTKIANKIDTDASADTSTEASAKVSAETNTDISDKIATEASADAKIAPEVTIEVNPECVTREWLLGLGRVGVTRISLGVQSLCDAALKAVGRSASVASTKLALSLIKKYWTKAFSADIIAGLPFDTKESLLIALDACIDAGATHISCYELTIEEGTPLAQRLQNGGGRLFFEGSTWARGEDEAAGLWIASRNHLIKRGFLQYEVSNFAKAGEECLHNKNYWAQGDYIGLGAGAVGTVGFERFSNTRDIAQYIKAPLESFEKEVLTEKEKLFERYMLGLRTAAGVGGSHPKPILALFATWQKLGWMKQNKNTGAYHLTPSALLFLNARLKEVWKEIEKDADGY